jgi:hypothetical protein
MLEHRALSMFGISGSECFEDLRVAVDIGHLVLLVESWCKRSAFEAEAPGPIGVGGRVDQRHPIPVGVTSCKSPIPVVIFVELGCG